ncbi:MAG: outer membrane lipoprotein-sorting protein [Spirochaetales bacterium]|nr:outer membrane lipoprotein-sorting protein [Spirochaetales bacterium]
MLATLFSRSMGARRIVLACIAAAALTAPSEGRAQTLTVEEVIERVEANRTHDTSRSRVRMTIRDRFGERESMMTSWTQGAYLTLIEFTSVAERGQKILRTEDEVYLFYPDAAELIRLQGAALRESLLGSDVSYEDLTGGRTLLDTYDATLEGRETLEGHDVYRVSLRARRRNVAYPRQTLWVDADMFVVRRAEQYSLNGRLLKTIEAEDIRRIDGINVPMRQTISDALKRNSSTSVEIEELEIGLALSNDLFSLEELSW